MARAIDKQTMLDLIIEAKRMDPETGSFSEWLAEYLVDHLPTLTPPNEPLTLEQLREMDGQPVWVKEINHWALIDIETGGRWNGIPFAVWAENGAQFSYNIKKRNLHCYRCKSKNGGAKMEGGHNP